ncbi:MAG: hypothetical protein A3B14_03030 [Candidatus Zambryskibacteria bacterium RIFCSPLOWO2_01_FULL_45_21]|uniref:Exopolysaccharide biosynthesis protein n=1 Tax=Candidatus Zambryskibacteria bacterium RIFCSPLOWO2_01_FULL_45_21 TaxID=1802761 RepID=A0A1G2U1W6_9BACT|nr:MAG: hypothetical protein A3B14_03030 [Candidatus Zambryskibacteria bacterium RIFCSPLOWO2_01_FULL_45_21]
MMSQMRDESFSQHLEKWLKSDRPKTLQGLIDNFAEKSFAILFLVLMSIPALPLPTGGVTHIFEIIAMLLALELIAGVRQVWLPKNWGRLNLSSRLQNSTLPFLIKSIRQLEKFTRPRLNVVISNFIVVRLIGLLVFILTFFAFVAPPFSGLDTLPSLGVVLIALAIILEDFLLFVFSLTIGLVGIGLVIAIGKTLISLIAS